MLVSVIVVAVWALIAWQSTSAPVSPKLPNPNGYEELVRAGKLVAQPAPDFKTASANELRAYVESNPEALALGRRALNHDSRVPVEFSSDYVADELPRLSAVRQVSRLLIAEGQLADKEGRYSEAAQAFLDLVRIGHEMERGGLMLHLMAGSAYQTAGLDGLERVRLHLDAVQAHDLLATLETVNGRRERFEQFKAREEQHLRAVNGPWVHFVTAKARRPTFQRARQVYDRNQSKMNQLIDDLTANRR